MKICGAIGPGTVLVSVGLKFQPSDTALSFHRLQTAQTYRQNNLQRSMQMT